MVAVCLQDSVQNSIHGHMLVWTQAEQESGKQETPWHLQKYFQAEREVGAFGCLYLKPVQLKGTITAKQRRRDALPQQSLSEDEPVPAAHTAKPAGGSKHTVAHCSGCS
jgi:hypothetical protein